MPRTAGIQERGERKARQRLAVKHHTVMRGGHLERRLPQYGENQAITCRKIQNTQARFCNRKRDISWLTPTVRHLASTHVNAVKKVCSFLPVTDMALEINRFAFLLIEDPEVSGKNFQNGPLKEYPDVEEKIRHDQEGKCLLCGKEIAHLHHIITKIYIPVSHGCGHGSGVDTASLWDLPGSCVRQSSI